MAQGAVAQFRLMGGAIGAAIATSVLNSFVKSELSSVLSQEQLAAVLDSTGAIGGLPSPVVGTVRSVFGQGYNLQMKILAGFAAAQVPSALLMWRKEQIRI